jgi:hypothetical protein
MWRIYSNPDPHGALNVSKTDHFIFKLSSLSVSRVAKSRINTMFIYDTVVIASLTNKDNLVTGLISWNQNIFLM